MSMRRAAIALLALAAAGLTGLAQRRAEPSGPSLHPSTMKVKGVGPLAGPTITVQEVVDESTAAVTFLKSDVVVLIKGTPTKGWAGGKVIGVEKFGEYRVTGTEKYRGATVYVVEPYRPAPSSAKDDPAESKSMGIVTAHAEAAKLFGKRVRISGIVMSWEGEKDLLLTFTKADTPICVMKVSAAERKKLPAKLPPSKWRITVDATIGGLKDDLLQLSDVTVVPPEAVEDPKKEEATPKPAPSKVLVPAPKAKAVPAETFVGRWRIVDDKDRTVMVFTLAASSEARKSHALDTKGKWKVVGDEAHITWDDGWRDVLKPIKGGMVRAGYEPGTAADAPPSTTQRATKEK
jgi:hypothetical protein